MACFYVYYDDHEYTEIQESPAVDLITLIANLGGTIGVFIGNTSLKMNSKKF